MFAMSSRYHDCSDEELRQKEVKYRRRAKRSEAGFGLSAGLGISTIAMTGGTAAAIVVPVLGYKIYKLFCRQKNRDDIREELAEHNISPQKLGVGDVFNYAVGMGSPLISHGISGVVSK